jgi:hypothetical protein
LFFYDAQFRAPDAAPLRAFVVACPVGVLSSHIVVLLSASIAVTLVKAGHVSANAIKTSLELGRRNGFGEQLTGNRKP